MVNSTQGDDPTLAIKPELLPGETVVWSGRPISRQRVAMKSLPQGLSGIVFVAGATAWMVGVSLQGLGKAHLVRVVRPFERQNVALAAFAGLLMLPPGFVMLLAPYWAWRKAGRLHYLLTDRRAIVLELGTADGIVIHSFPAEKLPSIAVEESKDGSGDLVFERRSTMVRGMTVSFGFIAVEKVREVGDLVTKTLKLRKPVKPPLAD